MSEVFGRDLTMAFRLEADEPVAQSLRRLIRSQLRTASREWDAMRDAEPERVVHGVRRRLKRVRAMLRLARPSLGKKEFARRDRRVSQAARPLSDIRDADVLVETFETLVRESDRELDPIAVQAIRAGLSTHRDSIRRRVFEQDLVREEVRTALGKARRDAKRWSVEGGWAILEAGLARVYKQGRRDLRAAVEDPDGEALHEWRKRVKDLWHALVILKPLRPTDLGPRAERAHQLADLLGYDHDLAVLAQVLADPEREIVDPWAVTAFLPIIESRRADLRQRAFPLGQEVYGEKSKKFRARLRGFRKEWRAEREVSPVRSG